MVEEDQSAIPKKDSRMQLAKFNDQIEPLFMLLQQVEGIKLAPELLEPEPVDISTIRGYILKKYCRLVDFLWFAELIRDKVGQSGHRENLGPVNLRDMVASMSTRRAWM